MERNITYLFLFIAPMIMAQPIFYVDGPDAPDMIITWDPATGLTFDLEDPPNSNNYMQGYQEVDMLLNGAPDPVWRFQGYAIYQFRSAQDVNDSVPMVIWDQARSLMIHQEDLLDTIDLPVITMDPFGADSCQASQWALNNGGVAQTHTQLINPFTGMPYHPDSTYCFAAIAFASNPYFVHTGCNNPQQVLFGKQSAGGALLSECVTPGAVGVQEVDADLSSIHVYPTLSSDQLNIVGIGNSPVELVITSSLGQVIKNVTLSSDRIVDCSGWSEGVYHLTFQGKHGTATIPTLVLR